MKKFPAWAILCMVAVAAGLLLGLTNGITSDVIEKQAAEAAALARQKVLPETSAFEEIAVEDGGNLLSCFAGLDNNGNVLGHVVLVSEKGYGGPVEVTVGVNLDGVIAGISVGGSNFSETVGLGAKVKEEAFTSQFAGMHAPIGGESSGATSVGIDAVTGATVSTNAVVRAVNAACEYAENLG